MMRNISLKLIPGDGIGVDVLREGRRVLETLEKLEGGTRFHMHQLDWGCRYYLGKGKMMPDDGLKILADSDSILLGAIGFPGVPDHISLRELLLPIRQQFDQYINLRPVKLLEGLRSPLCLENHQKIDFVVIRENTEGEYCGIGHMEHEGTPLETAVQVARFTRRGTSRVMKYAFEYARKHGLKKFVSATKSNALNVSMVFWDRIFKEIGPDYPEIEARSMHIDALAGLFITHPEKIDIVVASNLFGDILTDLGSAMLGSIGISPSANLNPEKSFPSMFEPVHGSAPDIAGKGIANPLGMIWSIVLMLEHLELVEMARSLMKAMTVVIKEGRKKTPDMGGVSKTEEVVDEIIAKLRAAKDG